MKKIIKAGSTDQTIDIFVQDSSSTTGAGLTGLVHNTGSLACYYRKGATGSATVLALVTQTVGGAHTDGGFVEISSANMPGMYRLDLSDAIVATAGTVTLMLKGATNMAPLPIELQVTAMDVEGGVVPTLTTYTGNTPQTGDTYALANGANGFAALKTQTAAIETDTGTDIPATLATIAAYLDTEIAAIKAKTDNLPADPADQSAVEAAILAAWTTALTEAYRTNGSTGTPAQLLYEILAHLSEAAIAGTTKTLKKLDHSTTAATFTLDDATNPTSVTRAT